MLEDAGTLWMEVAGNLLASKNVGEQIKFVYLQNKHPVLLVEQPNKTQNYRELRTN